MSFAEGYIDVATRIAEFRAKYPEGSLQPADLAVPYRLEEIGGKQRIVVVAAAYRTADDARPGIGMAYEEVPGRTQFTRDSELQNAETSAWGRAIVAALAADTKKGVASADEVRNRQADRAVPDDPAVEVKRALWQEAQRRGITTTAELAEAFAAWSGGLVLAQADADSLGRYLEHLRGEAA